MLIEYVGSYNLGPSTLGYNWQSPFSIQIEDVGSYLKFQRYAISLQDSNSD